MTEYGYPKSSGSVPESESSSSAPDSGSSGSVPGSAPTDSTAVSSSSGGIIYPISMDITYEPSGGPLKAAVVPLTQTPDGQGMTGPMDEGEIGISFDPNGDPVITSVPAGVSIHTASYNYE